MDKVILLIDDDADEHELFLTALQRIGKNCTFLAATGMQQALDILHDVTPDVIFLDINMPVKNGFACLKEIKHNEALKNIPVEMYSTSMTEHEKRRAMELGASGYLVKTNSFYQLCDAVKDVLKTQKVID